MAISVIHNVEPIALADITNETAEDTELLVERVMSTPPEETNAISPCFVRIVRLSDLQEIPAKTRQDIFKLPIRSLKQLTNLEELVKNDMHSANIFVS